MERGARLSPCRRYRYALWRRWGDGPSAMLVGLNPSTADEQQDDPTLRRCMAFARAWGYGALSLGNLFAWRATDPAALRRCADPVGPENDAVLRALAAEAGVLVAAWGVHGCWQGRDRTVRALLDGWHCLRLTRDGHPAHPLYLPGHLQPQPWRD